MAQLRGKTNSYGSVHVILPLLEYLEKRGLDADGILEHAGVSRSALTNTNTRLPKATFEELWRAAGEATGDPAIALRVSTMMRTNTLGIIGYLALASDSPRRAFELVKGLTPLLWENIDCDLESDDKTAFIRCSTGGGPQANRFTKEYAIGLTVTMSRALGGALTDPIEARFSYSPPPYADQYEEILGLPVRFDAGEDGVLFPISVIDGSNPSADAALRQLLERYAADQLAKISTSAPYAQRVRACILSRLPLGDLTAEMIAAQFSISGRTLRRRLLEEGTSYQEILDNVRAQMARDYLEKERRGIDEVAFLLGFSDQSAFSKAFRRWTGRTPADFLRSNSS